MLLINQLLTGDDPSSLFGFQHAKLSAPYNFWVRLRTAPLE
jgi:hypothetical protein